MTQYAFHFFVRKVLAKPFTADIGKSIAITFFMKYSYWY